LKKDGYEVHESTDLEEAKIPSSNISKFSSPQAAKRAASKQKYKTQIFMGDDGTFWVPSTNKEAGQLKKDGYEVYESADLEEAKNWWTVTITKKAGKLFKGQTVDVKATSLSDAIKKGLKQMKANPALVPSDAVDAELAESKFTEDLEEATLKKVEGSPANIEKDFKDLITNAKTIKGVTDDEYMRWYASMDEKIYLKWDKMVKAIPQYKKAYKLGVDGASGVSPFPKGTLASAIWSNEKAAGEMDS